MKLSMVNFKKYWKPFCKAIGRSDFPNDERYATPEARSRNMPSLIHEVTEAFKAQDLAYWHRALEDADIPHAAMPTYKEAADDEQKKSKRHHHPYGTPHRGQNADGE